MRYIWRSYHRPICKNLSMSNSERNWMSYIWPSKAKHQIDCRSNQHLDYERVTFQWTTIVFDYAKSALEASGRYSHPVAEIKEWNTAWDLHVLNLSNMIHVIPWREIPSQIESHVFLDLFLCSSMRSLTIASKVLSFPSLTVYSAPIFRSALLVFSVIFMVEVIIVSSIYLWYGISYTFIGKLLYLGYTWVFPKNWKVFPSSRIIDCIFIIT